MQKKQGRGVASENVKNYKEWAYGNATTTSPIDVCIHSIWRTLRGPFLLPQSICQHQDWMDCKGWEIYDFHAAGCMLCGCMHICKEGVCQCEKNEEGQDICCITGCCIKMLNFSDKEFFDSVCFHPLSSSSSQSADLGEENSSDFYSTASFSWDDGDQSVVHEDLAEKNSGRRRKRARTAAFFGPPPPPLLAQAPNTPRMVILQTSSSAEIASSAARCSVNKKNRYRSWVHHRMQVNNRSNGHVYSTTTTTASQMVVAVVHSSSPLQQQLLLQNPSPSPSSSSSSLPQQPSSSAPQYNPSFGNVEDETENIRSQIEMYVWDVLCSRKWMESMKMEVVVVVAFVFMRLCHIPKNLNFVPVLCVESDPS